MTKRVALTLAILTSFHVPAAVAAEWPPPPPGMAYETDLKPHSLVVTNVVLDGVAKTADLDGKRDKTDLKVYGQSAKPRLPAECFPVQVYGVNYGPDDVTYSFITEDNRCYFSAGPSWVVFSLPDLTFFGGHEMTFNGKTGIAGEWPKLEFATIPTADTLATTSTIAQIARSVVNTVWDSELGVAWEARMHNGALYYVAVTNRPPEIEE